jgi:hypothetical protein
VEAVRTQLAAPGWSKVLDLGSNRDGTAVEIYNWRDGDQPGGLAVLTAGRRQLSVINVIGPVDVSRLAGLQSLLGMLRLPGAIGGPQQ